MSADFEVRGADDFLRLSKALKNAGHTELRKGLHKALRDVVNEVKPKAAQELADALPSRMRGRGRAVKQAVQVKTGNDAGVSVGVRYGKAGRGIGAVNAKLINQSGKFRHPVFKTGRWVTQSTGGQGWFDKTYANEAPAMRDALERVLEDVANQIIRKAR